MLTLGGGYLFGTPMSRLRFRAGALIGFTFLAANDDKSNVTFSSFMLDPALEIRLSPSGRWFADVDVGIGLQMVSGLKANSHLLDPTVTSVSGAQGMVETRIGAGAGYRLTPELAAFTSFSQMHSEKKNHFYAPITRVEWLFALAYRM